MALTKNFSLHVSSLAHPVESNNCSPDGDQKMQLKSYLHSIGAEDSDLCECGEKDTAERVLLNCWIWRADRQELRAARGGKSRWDDMIYLLGGRSGQRTPVMER